MVEAEERPAEKQDKRDLRAFVAGAVVTAVFHVALISLLLTAGFSAADVASKSAGASAGRRRPPAQPITSFDRRLSEGFQPRIEPLPENSFSRRPILSAAGRRSAADYGQRPFRFVEIAKGRKPGAKPIAMKMRGIDYGPSDIQPLQAMLVPRLGLAKADPHKLPKLTKYEQPEKMEAGINISHENPDGSDLRFKEFDPKKAQVDRKRMKSLSLDDLIDAPDDDDPRKRATMLEDIVGSSEGQVWGVGSEGREGDVYLAKVENALRQQFHVPVFISREELKSLVVEIEIKQMDAAGRITSWSIRRKSGSPAFDSAAIEAVKRFVAEEGGDENMPTPEAQMLAYVNKRGILVRLEGKKLQ